MSPPISSDLRGRILAYGALKWSRSVIVKELKKLNFVVGHSTVSRVLQNHNKGGIDQSIDQPKKKQTRRPRVLTAEIIRKVKNYVASDIPPTQRDMGKRVGASAMLINRLIHGHLDKKSLKKTKVHALTPAAIEKRKIRALPFYNLINNRQFEFILTMDEAWLPYTMKNGKRDFYYDAKTVGERREDPPLTVQSPSHPQKRMFAAGYSWRGPTRFYVVEDKAKVNGEYFLEHILKPMMLVDVAALYGADADKVILHMDSAPSHTKKIVYNWLNSRGFKFFTKDQWLANSPEVSPMDFFANGYFKSELQKRKFRSVTGMIKAAKQVWSEIPLKMFQESLESWPARVLAIHEARGDHAPVYKK